jgi:hypothetical protein
MPKAAEWAMGTGVTRQSGVGEMLADRGVEFPVASMHSTY